METNNFVDILLQYGGTVVLALLFIWVFVMDKIKYNKILEDNAQMLKTLSESNNNISKSLDIISNNLVTLDKKIDRNYEYKRGGNQ